MNINTLVEYAHLFGLNDPAGIEITIPRERYGGVPDPASKERTVKAMLRNHLNRILLHLKILTTRKTSVMKPSVHCH
jgi:penicillin-binding protein 2